MKRKDAATPAFMQEVRQVFQEFLEGFQFPVDCNPKGHEHAGCRMNPRALGLTWKGSEDGIDEIPGRQNLAFFFPASYD